MNLPSVTLPPYRVTNGTLEGSTLASILRGCRYGWRVFLFQSRRWGHEELAMWETARYATRPALTTSSMRLAHPLFVTRSIDIARTRMLELLARLADEAERERFLAASLAIGAVTACADRDGARGWVPTPKTDSLYDRLQTLLAADLLNGPRVCDASAPLRHL